MLVALLKADLILSIKPLKKLLQLEKIPLIAFHAEEKVLLNHEPTLLNTFLIPLYTPLK